MKPLFFTRKHSRSGSGRSIGQAVAALVMAAAIAVGGAGTTLLLASQPAGLTVEPAATLQWDGKLLEPKAEDSASSAAEEKTEPVQEETAASSEAPASSAAAVQKPAAGSTSAPVTSKEEETAPEEPASETPAEEDPAAPEAQPEEAPTEDDPMAGSSEELDSENSLPHFVTETEALAAEDPLSAPEDNSVLPEEEPAAESSAQQTAASENGEKSLEDAQIRDVNGTVLLTPEEIREALDAGTLDEDSVDPNCLNDENGLLRWLWNFFFGKDDDEDDEDEAGDSSIPTPAPTYSGWRTENGKTYYYSQSTHQRLTGIHCIDNKLYYFDTNGVQTPATFGIDVSKYQANIDWQQVKSAGVEFAIIRIGYRGYGSGTLVMDPKFEEHFTNARNAGLRVGVYCFSQAVNENEAREEAQACVYVLNGRKLDYPIYFDTEASGAGNGRADGLGVTDRTKCAVAFCEEVKALGYQPGIYASTTWFRKRLDMSQLTGYSIWNAHYNVASSPIACNMWQGSCTTRIPGYGGQIDIDISYMG